MNIRDVMTPNPRTVTADDSIQNAARIMRDEDTGAVPVVENGRPVGIVTDRDIVVRALAEDKDTDVSVREAVSGKPVTVRPSASVDEAIQLMRDNAIRRLPVVDKDNRPVGIVTIGDLAREKDPRSVLGRISSAAPNN